MNPQTFDPFVNLHHHTDNSILDGYSTARETVARVAALGQPAIAFSDHGKLIGIYDGYMAAKEYGVKFIAAIEAYFTPSTITHDVKEPVFFGPGGRSDVSGKGAYTHLTMFAENNQGLENLFKLNLRASTEGFYRKPRMSLEMLADHSEGIICTTGCPSGEIQTRLRLGQYEEAFAYAARLVDIVGHNNVYVELMDHGMKSDLERGVREDLLRISRSLNLPLVATNDSHFACPEDAPSHEAMLAIQTGAVMSEKADHEGGSRFAFEGGSYYLKTAAEMLEIFPENEYPGAVSNTLVIADRCNIEITPREDLRPIFALPEGFTDETEYLKHLAYKGFKERLPHLFNDPKYNAQLELELGVIIPKNYSNYFLVTADLMQWARNNGIAVGSGRGCLSGDVNVLTPKGFKPIREISVGDVVFDETGTQVVVPEVFEYDCNEDLLEIKAFYGNKGVKLTTDHKILVSKANRETNKQKIAQGIKFGKTLNEPKWIRADEVELDDLVVMPKLAYDVNSEPLSFNPVSTAQTNITSERSVRSIARELGIARNAVMNFIASNGVVKSKISQKIADYMDEHNFTINDMLCERFITHTAPKSQVEKTFNAGRLFGLFISDGWFRTGSRNEIGFAQRKSEDEGLIPNLFREVFGLELKAFDHATSDLRHYTSSHVGVTDLFKELFPEYLATADSKYIPETLMTSSEEFRTGLLTGLWDGDGTHKGKSIYATVSPRLAENVYLLLSSLGLPASYKENIRTESRPEFNKSEREYYTEYKISTVKDFNPANLRNGHSYDDKFNYYRVREINTVKSDGKVYDFTVPTTHSYVTDSYVVHNSAGGSFLAFVMYITDVDPIKHDLLFERFLNPERDSPPDVDLDFDDRYRDRVYAYVVEKYGYEHVAQVLTRGNIKGKVALKDTGRILEFPYALSNELTKAYPPDIFGKSMKLNDIYKPSSDRYGEAESFREKVVELNAQKIVESALKLEGRTRSTGVHACAVLISGKPLTTTVPLEMRQKDEILVAQWEYPSCEAIGLLKMDFLGLRNLGIVDDCVALIKKNKGITVDLDAIKQGDMNDPKTYKLLADGNTLGIFQLDGGPMRDLLKMMKPTEFNDIAAVLALYRPGPMGVNAHTDYALRKNALQEVSYIHPELEEALKPILGDTYGLCVSGDTRIWDASSGKLVRIDSVEESVKNGDFYTFSVGKTGNVEKKKVTHWFETGIKEIFEITSTDGRKIRVSGDHPVLTLEGYKKASELTLEDMVATSGEAFSPEVASALTVDEARLLGYLIGDGYINFYQNTFINSDDVLIDHVSELAKKIFSDVHTYSETRMKNNVFSTKNLWFAANPKGTGRGNGIKGVYKTTFEMNQWLKNQFETDGSEALSSRSKFVPQSVFESSNEVIKHFLAALWDTDGHVGQKSSFLKTISKQLASDVQLLLDRLGMHGYIYNTGTYVSAKHGDTESYGVYVYDSDFYSEIQPLMKSIPKKAVIFAGGGQSRNDKVVSRETFLADMFPYVLEDETLPKHVISRLKNAQQLHLKSASNYIVRNSANDNIAGIIKLGKEKKSITQNSIIKEYLKKYASDSNKFNSSLRWSKIKHINVTSPEKVYDITVEGNHNFFAEGMVVHNCIYQEQIMKLSQVVAGYSLGEADILRRAMGKKKKSEMDLQWERFSTGAYERGFSKEAVQAIWDTVVPFADYAFNKSHSVAYGYMSYITAYLKANFPAEYMSALLTSTADSTEKTALYLDDAKQNKIQVLPPDINHSVRDYSPLSDTKILFGLKALKGVSDSVSDTIVSERTRNGKFADFSDVMNRLPRLTLNKRVLEAFGYGGAFDGMGYTRKSIITSLESLLKEYQKYSRAQKKQETMGASLFDELDFEEIKPRYEITPCDEYPNLEKLFLERQTLGLYVSGHPLDGLNFDSISSTKIAEILAGNVPSVEGFAARGKEPIITIAGIAASFGARVTKAGKPFGSGMLEDKTGSIDFVMFSQTFASYGSFMKTDGLYALTGYPQKRGEGFSFIVNSVRPLEFATSGNMPVRLKLTQDQWEKGYHPMMERLRVHENNEAKEATDVVISIRDFDGSVSEETLDIKVKPGTLLVSEMRELFGMGCIGRWRPRKPTAGPSEE